jgi:hypothetical protein
MFEAVPRNAAVNARLRVVIAGNALPFLIGPARILPNPAPRRGS